MALQLLDKLIDTIAGSLCDNIPIPISKKITKTESELDQHPDKMRLRKGYYHNEQGGIYQLKIVQKVQQEIESEMKQKPCNNNVVGDADFISLSQMLLLGNHCNRIKNKYIAGFQSLGATGGMKVLMKYIHTKYGVVNVYCPSLGWKVHQKIVKDNHLLVKEYKYPFQAGDNCSGVLVDCDNNKIKFKKGDVILLHGCGHNPTGIDPTIHDWMKIIRIIKQHELIPFFDYAYQGFVSGNVEKDSFAIKLFERKGVKQIFVVQSYSKNMSLYDKRIGCASVICESSESASIVMNDIKNKILKNLYDNEYPPNNQGAQIVIEILSKQHNFAEWKQEVTTMYQRIQTMRKLLQNKLQACNKQIKWNFITLQVGMFAFKHGLFNSEHINILKNKYHVYITDDGRIAMGCITSPKQLNYFVDAINFALYS